MNIGKRTRPFFGHGRGYPVPAGKRLYIECKYEHCYSLQSTRCGPMASVCPIFECVIVIPV